MRTIKRQLTVTRLAATVVLAIAMSVWLGAFDPHKNFAVSTVATPPSPSTTGTSLIVSGGDGAKFPTPPFNATVWPAGAQATTTNSEIVRVTAISTDTFTIARTQEFTSARAIVGGDNISATITAKVLTDVEALIPTAVTVTTTGNITSLPLPGGTGDQITSFNNASLATIQGMTAGLYTGQRWTIRSIGAGQVDLSHNDGAATGAKLANLATGGKSSLAAGVGTAEFVYDGTKWAMAAHEQGDYIAVAFSAGDYTASTGNWTLTSGDVTFYKYWLRGRELTLAFRLDTTTVSATPNTLRLTLPLGFTTANTGGNEFYQVGEMVNNGSGGLMLMGPSSGHNTQVYFYITPSASWATATDNTTVSGLCRIPIT